MSDNDYTKCKAILQEVTLDNIDYFSFDGLKCYVRVVDVYDGDTVTVIMSYNSSIIKLRIRLLGINAAEIKSSDKLVAVDSRNQLLYLITQNVNAKKCATRNDVRKILHDDCFLVWIECDRMDKYGRVLAKVYKERYSISLSEQMLAGGFALAYQPEK